MKKKKLGVLSVVILLSCAAVFIFAMSVKDSDTKLTEKQISGLRAEYPICYGEPPNVDMVTPTLDKVINRVDTFVYGKVIGDVSYYYRDISTGHEVLDKKRAEKGLSNTFEFYEYTIEVISDTQNIIDTPEITITQNAIFEPYSPTLKDGMEVLVPVGKTGISESKPLRYSYDDYGFFYVTEDGYVLSAFEEDTKTKKSGIKVDSLMKQLKQQKDDMLKATSDTETES